MKEDNLIRILSVGQEKFDEPGKRVQFMLFMDKAFNQSGGYLATDYIEEWADRVNKNIKGACRGHVRPIWEEVFER